MLRKWQCRLLRARLVELAEGTLEPSREPRLQRHLSQCADCTAALAALADIPAVLRNVQPHDDEELWRRQRQNIMRAIRSQAEPKRLGSPFRVRWGMGLGAAAALLLAVIGYQELRYPGTPLEKQPVDLASLDVGSVFELAELTQGAMPQGDWVLGGVSLDDADTSQDAYVPWIGPPASEAESGLGRLNDDELDRLSDLLGEQMG